MSRHAGFSDFSACREVARQARENAIDVVHGHGAKGGAYARLTGRPGAIRVYTPHGGSLHFSWASPTGMVYLTLERMLMRRTDLFLFESEFGRTTFTRQDRRGRSRARGPQRRGGGRIPADRARRRGERHRVRRRVAPSQGCRRADRRHRRPSRRRPAADARPSWEPDPTPPRSPRGPRHGARGQSASSAPCRRVQAFALGRLLVVPSRANRCPISCSRLRRPGSHC